MFEFLYGAFKLMTNGRKVNLTCLPVSSFISKHFAQNGDTGLVMLPITKLPGQLFGDQQRLKQILVNLLHDEIGRTREHGMVRVLASYDYGK